MDKATLALQTLFHNARGNKHVDECFLKEQKDILEKCIKSLELETLANRQLSEYAENWNDFLELEESTETFLLSFHEVPYGKPVELKCSKEILDYIKINEEG